MEQAAASLLELSSLFYPLYTWAMIALLLFTILLKGVNRNETLNWLYVFNTAMAWLTLLNLLCWLCTLFLAWYGQNPYEWYAFTSSPSLMTPVFYWWIGIAIYLGGLLFFFRALRIKRSYIIFFLLLENYSKIIIFFARLQKEYVPTALETGKGDSPFLVISKVLFLIMVLGVIYRIACRRKKLPAMTTQQEG